MVDDVCIHRIEVHNFKSYKGKQTIGPFTDFTAVIGPNGSGKSNLMDAICFGMGLRAGALRGGNLKDLIYSGVSGGEEEQEQPAHSAFVRIVMRPKGQEGPETVFQRSISAAGVSEYRINGKAMPFERYDSRLKDLGLLTKSRNFLVFQGDVQNISTKSPKDLTAMLEEISGSADLRDEYTVAKRELEKKSEEVAMMANRKRGMRSEKTEYRQQIAEMKRYRNLLAQRDEERSHKVLFQLFQLELELRVHLDELARVGDQASEAEAAEQALEGTLQKKEAEFASFNRNFLLAEDQVKEAVQNISKERPHLTKSERALRNVRERIQEEQTALQRKRSEAEQVQETVQELETQLQEVEEAFREFEEQARSQHSQEFSELLGSQMDEYNLLKEQAGQKTVTLTQKVDRMRREREINLRSKTTAQEEKSQLENQKETHIKNLHADEERLETLERGLRDKTRDWEAKKAEVQRLEAQRLENDQRKRELERTLEEVTEEIKTAKSRQQESDRELRMKEAVDAMKGLFPRAVKGKLHDLCSIRREFCLYAVAVTAAMGRNMDAIVVDTSETAKECLKYLKEHRTGTATFLPLDSLSVKPVNESLRSLQGSAKLVMDVITFDSSVERAVQYACGNAVVFDTLGEAREACFRRQAHMRLKAVTKDGSIIHKNGLMAGGFSGLQRRAQRWEAVNMTELKLRKDRTLSLLKELRQSLRTQDAEENQAKSLSSSLEQQVKSCTLDVAATRKRIGRHQTDLQQIDKLLQEASKAAAEAQRKLETQDARIAELEEEITSRTVEMFSEFSARVGVSDIREYEEKYVKESMVTIDRRSDFERQVNRLRSSISYERSRAGLESVEQLEEQLAADRAEEKRLEKQVKHHEDNTKRLKNELKELEKKRDECKRELDTRSVQRKELKAKRRRLMKERTQCQSTKTTVENKIMVTRSKRARIIQQAQLEEIAVPVGDSEQAAGVDPPRKRGKQGKQGGSSSKGSGKRGKRGAAKGKKGHGKVGKRGRRGGAPMSVDVSDSSSSSSSSNSEEEVTEEEEVVVVADEESNLPMVSESIYLAEDLEEDASQSMDSQGRRRRYSAQREGIVVSFAELPAALRKRMSPSQVDKVLGNLDARIREIVGQIEASAPNKRAEEHMQDVDKRFKDLTEEEQALRDDQREAARAFERIKERRCDLFMQAFQPISEAVEEIYQQLTRSQVNTMGGTAYLALENSEEPFLAGVKYHAMPPAKRFRDMEALSGGEQTVAALALLFAIQHFHPSPFFVMDEIDAALDEVNVSRLVQYVQERSSADRDRCQFIVISLKESLYSRANSLVGICRDTVEDCSQALSLDLSAFPVEV